MYRKEKLMKIKYMFLKVVLIILLTTQYYCLGQQKDSVSEPVREYWHMADSIYTNFYKYGKGVTKKFSNSEVDTIVRKYYKMVNTDPAGYKKFLLSENNKWNESMKKQYNKNSLRPSTRSMIVKDEIAKRYGQNFANIISIPYYLEVKIIKDSSYVYVSKITKGLRAPATNLTCLVLDVIKGGKFFHKNQQITIGFMSYWLANAKQYFEVGKTYFVPIEPWFDNGKYDQLTIFIFPDRNYAIYPIDNGFVSTPGNYFDIGEKTDWLQFKREFIKKYVLN